MGMQQQDPALGSKYAFDLL
ncbi:hypothetical protein C370_07297 [Cryptococcus neoformans A1-35-8]|nr:hypothetical protein C369_07376 [Cryptococcus neoformans var. grubii A5-35-17]OXH00698.1 hypothetical protein C370_07297 [Cryptococcus neoformans var. grubii A1-35-8]